MVRPETYTPSITPDPVNNVLYNSARWDGFTFRDGDIVISTPAKCGTTWTQRIVSLLVFDSPELCAPMARISPWLDMNTRALDEVLRELEAQTHRRFIKSHLDYGMLPKDARVTFITVGRDPRDVAVSWSHHFDNVDMNNFIMERAAAVGLDDLADMAPEDIPSEPGTAVERFWGWMDQAEGGLQGLVEHLKTFWDHRGDPNVVLLHYADLQRDLVQQMEYLAGRLGIERSRERIEQLAPYATFDEMKANASQTAPNGDQTFWKNTTDFFHAGTSGQWHDLIGDDDLPRYDKRVGEVTGGDAELAHWLHTGTSQPPE